MAEANGGATPLGFTEKKVRELPVPAKGQRALYVDTEPTRLRLRVTPTAKTWFVQYRPTVAAGSVRYSIGTFPNMSVVRARDEAKKIFGRVASAESPAEARRALRDEATFGELAKLYFEDRTRAKKRTVKALQEQYERWLGELPDEPAKKFGRKRVKPAEAVDWSKRRLSEIDRESVEALHKRIRDATPTISQSTGTVEAKIARKVGGEVVANRIIEQLRAIFEFGLRREIAKENPAKYVARSPERERGRFLQAHELTAFQDAVNAEQQPWRDYFTVLLYVGYRRSAVAAMAWSDVNLDAGTWRVPDERAKNGEPITLALSGLALEALLERAKKPLSKKWVFPGDSVAGHISSPRKAWMRVCARAGLTDARMHDLRRTLGSWMAMSGLSLPAIGRALGHKDPRSTEVYAHLQADAVKAAVDQAHEAMAAAAKRANVVPLRRGTGTST